MSLNGIPGKRQLCRCSEFYITSFLSPLSPKHTMLNGINIKRLKLIPLTFLKKILILLLFLFVKEF